MLLNVQLNENVTEQKWSRNIHTLISIWMVWISQVQMLVALNKRVVSSFQIGNKLK